MWMLRKIRVPKRKGEVNRNIEGNGERGGGR